MEMNDTPVCPARLGCPGWPKDGSECPYSECPYAERKNDLTRGQCVKLATCPKAIEHVRTTGRPYYKISPCVYCGEYEPESKRHEREGE